VTVLRRGTLKRHADAANYALRGLDLLVMLAAGLVAFRLKFDTWRFFDIYEFYWYPFIVAALLASWVFRRYGLYEPWRGAALTEEIRSLALAWGTVIVVLIILAVATKTTILYSRVWIGLWFVLGLFGLIALRLALRIALGRLRARGINLRSAIVLGSGALAREVVSRIEKSAWTGIRVLGYLDEDGHEVASMGPATPRLGSFADLPAFVNKGDVDQIWIALPLREEDKLQRVLHELRHATATIRYVPDIFAFRLLNHSISEVAGLPVVDISATPMEGGNRAVKLVEDLGLAALVLLLVSPLMLAIAIGVKLSSPGPVFYRQERVGWNGRPFQMLKFRSMPVDVESETGPTWAKAGEDRATRIGAFLRRTSLDELPQFINVLRGEMSIVGPRPERPVFVDRFKDEIPDYMKKHLVKAGITGWAQVNGWRGDTDLHKRIEYDLYYIENWSLWFDIKIILLTLIKGFVHRNAY
jgi:putative colanic acid biosynthesis UDP-glucose lipid carrier transferase